MNCGDSEILLNALIDGELDAGHARDVEKHVALAPPAPRSSRNSVRYMTQ